MNVRKHVKVATWWQQQEVLQLPLVTVKVLQASFLLVLLPLVLAQASLSNGIDASYQHGMATAMAMPAMAMSIVYQIQQGLHQALQGQYQARRTPGQIMSLLTSNEQVKVQSLISEGENCRIEQVLPLPK